MVKVAISGKNGFIGQHLAKRLEDEGYKVIEVQRWLLGDPFALQTFMQKEKPDYIFHLAAYGNHSTQNDEDIMFRSNIVGTYELLKSIKNLPIKGIILFGSSSEYGIKDSTMHEADLVETDTFYGASKVASTYLGRAFARKYDKNIVTVRPFSVYGEGEADFRFIPTAIRCLLRGEILLLDQKTSHDWIYIEDFIEGCLKVLKNIKRLKGQIINIGTGKQYSNEEIVSLLEAISNLNLTKKIIKNTREDNPTLWVAWTNKLRLLGWKQNYSIREGLTRTYEYYKQRFKA